MMLTRIQKGNNIYAVYELNDAQIDKISFMMINSNQEHNIGLAPITFEEMNGVYYKMLFDVTGKVTLREYIGKHISQEDFRQMLLNLIETIEQFDEYMIDVNRILLDMDCVYINAIDHSIAFLCIALKNVTQAYQPYEFFRAVVQNSYVNLNINEVSYFNHIWNITSDEKGFSLSNMKAAMEITQKDTIETQFQQKSEPIQKNMGKIEEPQEITISKATSLPAPAVPAPAPEKQKNNGFLSRLTSSFLKKNNPQEKKKSSSTGYHGGLAGLKGGISRDEKTTFLVNSENPVLVEAETKPISALVQSQGKPAVPTAQPFINEPIHQGTTVLKGRTFDASSPRNIPSTVPQFLPPPETTVLTPPKQDIPETTVLIAKSPIQETTVLKNTIAAQKTACLIRLKNHSRFFINKPLFSIGRGLSETDCSVNDNTNVSRHHADIVRYDLGYFISVITKTNVTYLNEIKLEQGAEVKLADGDKIRLADEEFEFRIV